jgi:tetratricopeptide (TPR) repeat protein
MGQWTTRHAARKIAPGSAFEAIKQPIQEDHLMRSLFVHALVAGLLLALLPHDADASARKSKRSAHTPAQATALQALGDRDLCDGGVLISAPDQARGCTRLISGRQPRSLRAIAYYNRANARMRMAQVSAAIVDYTDALRLAPNMREALFNRAIAHQAIGAADAALADLDATLRLAPGDVDALVARARIHLKGSKLDLANADFDKVLSQAPAHGLARLGRAHLRARLHDWTGATADYERVLQANPRDAEALYGRGLVRTWSGAPRQGAEDMRLAMMLDPAAADRLATMGLRLTTPNATAMANQR